MKVKYKIGIFDSGLGGLSIARAIRKAMPEYYYVYLGDAKGLPYGNKSQAVIYRNTVRAVEYLFKNDCALVIVACNTASSQALRKIQQEWLPNSKYRDRRVLGVIRPTVESVGKFKNIGLIGTLRTIDSSAYLQELKKVNRAERRAGKNIKLTSLVTPKLVDMVETGKYDGKILKKYLSPFKNSECLILGCTHYGVLKGKIGKILGRKVRIIAQEDIIPGKLKNYLKRHPEISGKLSKNRKMEILATKITKSNKSFSPSLVSL